VLLRKPSDFSFEIRVVQPNPKYVEEVGSTVVQAPGGADTVIGKLARCRPCTHETPAKSQGGRITFPNPVLLRPEVSCR
jgi:hypothetical protein